MRTSTFGVKTIAGFEGTILHLYADVAGILTVCTGHVKMPGEDWSSVTREKCEATLARDLSRFEDAINQAVDVDISQPMFDAMMSLAFNIGTEGFRTSSVLRFINQSLYTEAASAFLLWRFAHVKQKDGTFRKLPVLLGRRSAEAQIFQSGISAVLLGGDYDEPPIEDLVTLAQVKPTQMLFDLRSILDDRGLPIQAPDELLAYADDGRMIAMPPDQEESV